MDTFLFVCELLIIVLTGLAFLYCIGIVWRVEGELDSSYKCFALAILAFLISELLGVYYTRNEALLIIEVAARTFFALFLLIGIIYMRDIVKHIDSNTRKRSKK